MLLKRLIHQEQQQQRMAAAIRAAMTIPTIAPGPRNLPSVAIQHVVFGVTSKADLCSQNAIYTEYSATEIKHSYNNYYKENTFFYCHNLNT